MSDKLTAGQEAARMLTVFSALLGDGGIKVKGYEPHGVEVVAVLRDNWPDAPVYVTLATIDGQVTRPLDEIEIIG